MVGDTHLFKYAQSPSCKFSYKNINEKRAGGAGLYICDSVEYKVCYDLNNIDETAKHMWIEWKENSRKKLHDWRFIPAEFGREREKPIWIEKQGTIFSITTNTWD